LFSPKESKSWSYSIQSSDPSFASLEGGFTSVMPSPEQAAHPSARYPNWWVDDPDPRYAERGHLGAKTVSRWRVDFLRDFAQRLRRLRDP
jgi:hypothetical protein